MIWINFFKMSKKWPNILHMRLQLNQLATKTTLIITALALNLLLAISTSLAQVPADHLVPPPLPANAPPLHLPQNFAPFLPNPQPLTHKRPQRLPPFLPYNAEGAENYATNAADQSGIMTRIARWFGFTSNAQEQQLVAASTCNQPAYAYPKPQEQLNYNSKAPCNLCNKYPWIPMMPLNVQYPQLQPQQQQQQHQQQNYQQLSWQQHAQASKPAPAFAAVNQVAHVQPQQLHKQRAVHFKFPTAYQNYQALKPPLLTPNPTPPLYNAQPFRTPTTTTTTTFSPLTEQQLPTTAPAHFTENVGAHSELRPDQIRPSNQHDSGGVEIIKSQSVTDFVSSIEYPATFVQSQSIDLNLLQPPETTAMPENHKIAAETNFGTVSYQHVPAHITNHVPASQLLTDPSNLSTTFNFETTNAPTTYPPPNHKPYEEPPYSVDNLSAASSLNNHNSFSYQTNEIFDTTTDEATQTSLYTTTEKSTLEFLPSLQTQAGKLNAKSLSKERGTPKRLLDAPIQHGYNAGSPRPFTRDPSELNYRLGAIKTNSQAQLPLLPTVTPPPAFAVSSQVPTPTSTYGAVDASGQYAGMPPPAPPLTATKNVQQIIVPYTTKNRPRPFQSSKNVVEGTTTNFLDWQHSIDLHEQQESKVVISTAVKGPTSTTTTSSTTRAPTTRYITKILASNLRDLLRREQAMKNRSNLHTESGFDLKKLQKNIDDWTEQEFTSLSHRPSTPTIRGRSKHIPASYLTTTTTPAPSAKALKSEGMLDSTALSTSINNLESSAPKTHDRGSKHFVYPAIEENTINDLDSFVTKATTTTTTPATPSNHYTPPIYTRPTTTEAPPEVLWQKAKVLIKPDTHEKVYVVTPQPRFFPQRVVTTSTEAPLSQRRTSSSSPRKTGRFIVRPTPGNGASNSTSTTATLGLYSPAPFGLMGLSAFVPAKPVEIIDGNSKVVTIVTPSSVPKTANVADAVATTSMGRSIRTDYVTINRTRTKPTMSPTPR